MLLEFDKITEARAHLREIYDSAASGVPALVRRENDPPVAVVRADSLKEALRVLCPVDVQVRLAADGSASMWVPGLPVSAQGGDFDAAARELLAALRDYADAWADDLRRYPNHADNWGVVCLTLLSDDDELLRHLFGAD
jgi:hypothetical protein